MNVPMPVKLLALVLGATLFYTWVGSLVPQKEVHPPEVVELADDLSTEELVEIGKTIYEGKGLCNTCHTIGKSGALRFPDMAGIAETASTRVPGFGQLDYLAQSIYQPNAFIVPGFNPGMPAIDKPPIGLSDGEILSVIAYLQTLGGEATVSVGTQLPYADGAEPTSDVDPAGGTEVADAIAGSDTVAPPQTATVTQAGAAAGPAQALLERYACNECHGEGGEASRLAGLGTRRTPADIRRALVDHEPPLPASYTGRVTLAEVSAMTEYLSNLEEGG